jgi:hypothetical protein
LPGPRRRETGCVESFLKVLIDTCISQLQTRWMLTAVVTGLWTHCMLLPNCAYLTLLISGLFNDAVTVTTVGVLLRSNERVSFCSILERTGEDEVVITFKGLSRH